MSLTRPKCSSLYNLFYAVDPLGFRLEPLIDESFSTIDPLLIPCYLVYPTGECVGCLKEGKYSYKYINCVVVVA